MQNYNLKFKILTFCAIILIFAFSIFNFAPVAEAGLVPCGGVGQDLCNWCHFGQLIKNIIDFFIKIAIVVAVIFIIWGGFIIMTASSSPERLKSGQDILQSAIIGIIIVFVSWILIDTIIKVVLQDQFQMEIGPWNQISC